MEELNNQSNENEKEKKEELLQDSYNEDENEFNELIDSNIFENIKGNINIFKKFNIYFYLNLNTDNIFIFNIKTNIFEINKSYIYELIKDIVNKINDKRFEIKYNSFEYIISLKDIEEENKDFYIKNYELKPCKKKNYLPKFDSPSYSSSSLIKNIENENISFISKNPLNILLMKKERNYEESKSKYQIDEEEYEIEKV